jgi:hypothetical protein
MVQSFRGSAALNRLDDKKTSKGEGGGPCLKDLANKQSPRRPEEDKLQT